jgi:hypothetical protein
MKYLKHINESKISIKSLKDQSCDILEDVKYYDLIYKFNLYSSYGRPLSNIVNSEHSSIEVNIYKLDVKYNENGNKYEIVSKFSYNDIINTIEHLCSFLDENGYSLGKEVILSEMNSRIPITNRSNISDVKGVDLFFTKK